MKSGLTAVPIAVALLTSTISYAQETPAPTGFGGAGSSSPYLQIPSAEQFVRYYPERAMSLGVEGRASIVCTITDSGGVKDCLIASETPPGYEFGAAAVKLSALFKMKPKSTSGAATAGTQVTIPIAFRLANTKPEPGDNAVMTTAAYWATRPTQQDLEGLRPAGLSEGYAVLQCHIREGLSFTASQQGTLMDCKSVKFSNANLSAAALKLAPLFQLKPTYAAMASLDSIIQFSLIWPPR